MPVSVRVVVGYAAMSGVAIQALLVVIEIYFRDGTNLIPLAFFVARGFVVIDRVEKAVLLKQLGIIVEPDNQLIQRLRGQVWQVVGFQGLVLGLPVGFLFSFQQIQVVLRIVDYSAGVSVVLVQTHGRIVASNGQERVVPWSDRWRKKHWHSWFPYNDNHFKLSGNSISQAWI